MPLETFEYDSAEFLGREEAIAEYLLAASEDGDANHIARALGVVARARHVRSFSEYRTYTTCSLPGIKWGWQSRVCDDRKGS
jgi:DNA-binding phage protein